MNTADRRALLAAFNPSQPLEPRDHRYVRFEHDYHARGSSRREILRVIQNAIDAHDPKGASHQLVTGYPGSGKTTELLRLRDSLLNDKETPTFAVLVDGEDYFDLYSESQIADLLRVLAFELDRHATIAEGGDPQAGRGYLLRFWEFLQSDVQFKEMGFQFAGIELMAELRKNPKFRELTARAMTARFQAFADQAHTSIRESVERIRKATAKERVVVIVDSLEKFRPFQPEDSDRIEGSVERLFLQHADLMKVPCHVVYTFPLFLRYRTGGALGNTYGSEPVVLPMVKAHREDGEPHAPGIDALCELIRKREGDSCLLFGKNGDPLRRQIALASGGYPRDVIRLCRNLILKEDQFPVDEAAVERVVSELEYEYANVFRDTYLDTLVYIARHHQLPQTNDQSVRLAGDLVQRFILLSYRNGREWYGIHPLLQRHPKVAEALRKARSAPPP